MQKRRILEKSFQIEGMKFQPSGLNCSHNMKTGRVECSIVNEPFDQVDFTVQNFTEYQELDDDYML